MTKRRDFIMESLIGTTGIDIGRMGFSCKSSTSAPVPTVDAQPQKDWRTKPDYSESAVAELVRCYNNVACGVGELSDKGSGLTDTTLPRDKMLHPDDPRLDAFWEKCTELKMQVNLHIADNPSCWTPLDVFQERTPDYQHFNKFGKDFPLYDELITMRDRILEKHPKTIFIACHLSNQGNDLGKLSLAMDKYPQPLP